MGSCQLPSSYVRFPTRPGPHPGNRDNAILNTSSQHSVPNIESITRERPENPAGTVDRGTAAPASVRLVVVRATVHHESAAYLSSRLAVINIQLDDRSTYTTARSPAIGTAAFIVFALPARSAKLAPRSRQRDSQHLQSAFRPKHRKHNPRTCTMLGCRH